MMIMMYWIAPICPFITYKISYKLTNVVRSSMKTKQTNKTTTWRSTEMFENKNGNALKKSGYLGFPENIRNYSNE